MEPIALDTIPDANPVRATVRDFYGARVRAQNSCCCSSTTEATLSGINAYDEIDLSLIPEESAAISYGCGNPGAIAALQPGEVVLDMGSGGGIDCFFAAERVGPTGHVYGVDMTDEMLDVARRAAARQGRTNVEFRKGVIEALPIESDRVDVIISNCVLNLSPDKPAAFAEAFRVLRPGGRLAVSDVVIDGRIDDLPISEATLRQALSWGGCIGGALTIDTLKSMLRDAGFTEITVEPVTHYSAERLDATDLTQPGMEAMTPELLADLARRFASASISAIKPAR
jgi:SAM-dependent methyltransferase